MTHKLWSFCYRSFAWWRHRNHGVHFIYALKTYLRKQKTERALISTRWVIIMIRGMEFGVNLWRNTRTKWFTSGVPDLDERLDGFP